MPPALSASLPFHTLVSRNATTTTNATANTTNVALQVICAWPVSGQYGPGSRVLYYALVAACVFARKTEWLRNACLAAALLFPAVAAIHGIVLAAVNIKGAVDMDVYGAFQLCSIGILAAPVTVKVSRTYFYDPGRNAIFVWTGLLLAGLLSLTVQFYRITTSNCTHDELGNPISLAASEFHYNTTCGLICSVKNGPHSPMRGGAANDIYVIPAPDKLTFGMATLLAAACCIPAVLSLVSMWNKILEINWKTRFGNREVPDELIEGTNGATPKGMDRVNGLVKQFLNVVELPVFGAAVLAILIIGERNFFSDQVRYQTEPIASIGQWAPIAGTGLAVLGSLYILLAKDLEEIKKGETPDLPENHSDGSGDESPRSSHSGASVVPSINAGPEMDEIRHGRLRGLAITTTISQPECDRSLTISPSRYPSSRGCDNQPPKSPIRSVMDDGNQLTRSTTVGTVDVGNRRRVASMMKKFSNIGSAAQDRFDDSEFKHGPALDFPQIPGEVFRNKNLPQIMKQYNQPRDTDEYTVRPSRAGSFTGSIASGFYSPGPSRGVSPHPRSPSPSPQSRSNTLPAQRPSDSIQRGRPRPRGNTLQVPPVTHHNPPSSPTVPEDQGSPTIVVSQDFATPFHPPDAVHLSKTRTAGTDENDPH